MLKYSDDKWTYKSPWLRSTFEFKSYSDARLAEICIKEEVPLPVLDSVLRLILDPQFKTEDVTFKCAGDIPRYFSDLGKENALKRAVAVNPSAATGHTDVAKRGDPVPSLVLGLVVNWIVGEQKSMSDMESWVLCSDRFLRHTGVFRTMSLVHRSWTPIAQSELRNRAVIQWSNIKPFLFKPVCGPRITEMTIFWTFQDGHSFPTENDLWLLDELLRRTPNVRSLKFNTSLTWYMGDSRDHSLEIDRCFEIIANRLPHLENLLLWHDCEYPRDCPCDGKWCRCFFDGLRYRDLTYCPGIPALCDHLPSMISLKRLSIHGWEGCGTVDWTTHPPAQLKAVELDCLQDIDEQNLKWLLNPRREFSLTSLFLSFPYQEWRDESTRITVAKDCLSKVKRLSLYVCPDFRDFRGGYATIRDWCQNVLGQCEELASLEYFVKEEFGYMAGLSLPPSLESLSVHYKANNDTCFPYSSGLDQTGQQLAELLQRNMPRLPRLRTLLFTALLPKYRWWTKCHLVGNRLPGDILELCRDHGVEVIC